ncbi:hypothetical protein [Streptomyces minutiscleroticus]|uniref:Uncharacterized protein n=1 Tax=Streptomyces minutiscleroticus TaxID=68238 RepID=A0A918NRB5_9ACTN|nr:hypothetical protein [Streptomyces minutiscleroticus]GGX89735.1 hypothetical protein GCM10010358_49610 [Streptomyces minutiscleroticus]
MPTPATPAWQTEVEVLCADLEALCEDLADAPLEERLRALELLHRSFKEMHDRALRGAARDARAAGWGLRRIAAAVGRSHEQVRILTTPAS